MDKTTSNILLVEDDALIASGLVYALEKEGYRVEHAVSVAAAAELIRGANVEPRTACAPGAAGAANTDADAPDTGAGYDLFILDMQLPDGTGWDVMNMRTGEAVIFLTVADDEGNLERAFDSGADDYISKPFRMRELLARVRAALARRSGGARSEELRLGDVTIDTKAGRAYIAGQAIELTALEYRLLLTFAANKGNVLSRNAILESLWDSAGSFVEDNTLTVYIKRLREKLGDAASIETLRGLGYRAG